MQINWFRFDARRRLATLQHHPPNKFFRPLQTIPSFFIYFFFILPPFRMITKEIHWLRSLLLFFFNLFFFLMNKYIYMYRFYWQTAPLKCGIDCFWYLPSFSVTIWPSWISPVNGNQFGSITEIIHTIDKSCHNLLYVKKKKSHHSKFLFFEAVVVRLFSAVCRA